MQHQERFNASFPDSHKPRHSGSGRGSALLSRLYIPSLLALALLAACGKPAAHIEDVVKVIPLSGGHDTLYMERSRQWDRSEHVARTDSNRQTISFKPSPGDVAFVTLRNMGGVPLKRDTIRGAVRLPAEIFLRTGTLDTNMHLRIEFSDWKRTPTDVIVYVRNRDTVYREFLFSGK